MPYYGINTGRKRRLESKVERQSVTIHYRRFVDEPNLLNGKSLETAINDAMLHAVDGGPLKENWSRRTRALPETEDTHFINLFADGNGHFFGDLSHYTRGHMQALLERADGVPFLNVSQMPAPEGREYLHSVMYWLTRGNHVLVLQSRSIGTKQLEEYLTWLLQERSGVAPTGSGIILESVLDIDEVGGDLDDISEIIIGGSPLPEPPGYVAPERGSEQVGKDIEQYTGLDRRRAWASRMREVLRAVMSSEADVDELLGSVPEGADLDVTVQIGYKLKKRSISREPMQRALRNLPDGDIRAISKGGRQTGRDVRLSYSARVQKNGSLLDPGDVERALREAYDHFVSNGKIQP